MTRLFITRHGQTEWNLEGRFQGQLDSKLTRLGVQQAKWLGERLKDEALDIIYTSTLGRAHETAQIIKGDRDIDLIKRTNLQEINIGCWQGMLHTDIAKLWPNEENNFWNHPQEYRPISNSETYPDLIKRISDEIQWIVENNKGKNILIVTHGIALKAYFSYIKNIKLRDFWKGIDFSSTSLSVVDFTPEPIVLFEGDTSHYKTESMEVV